MPAMSETKDAEKLSVYESHPPAWLPTFHGSADLGIAVFSVNNCLLTHKISLGYPGFHPPRPGHDEDVLTENSVKIGYILSQSVSVSLPYHKRATRAGVTVVTY